VISDAALPLFDRDEFTAQQVASLKPFYGKAVYDRFIRANPFVQQCFPNFDPARHRNAYPELESSRLKRFVESVLRLGPVQLLERVSRFALGNYLRKKAGPPADEENPDVLLEPRRLKLHLVSHKREVLARMP